MKQKASIILLFSVSLLSLVMIGACTDHGVTVEESSPVVPDTLVLFSADIHPLLQNSCMSAGCHVAANPGHGLNMTTYETLMDSSQHKHVIAGHGDDSPLYIAVSPRYTELGILGRMPLGRTPLSEADQNKIRKWINQGALNN